MCQSALRATICRYQHGNLKLVAEENPRYLRVRRTQEKLFTELKRAGDDRAKVDFLDPKLLIEYMGFTYKEVTEIPSQDPKYRTAGYLDRDNKEVVISLAFLPEQRRMTAMHEAVHIILHEGIGKGKIHRDRPIDFGAKSHASEIEREATEIASLCLMPERLVHQRFAETFRLNREQPLKVDEDVAFHLGVSIDRLSTMDLRATTLHLVRATTYGYDRAIRPLHQQLKVSPSAMAIRLEELKLVIAAPRRGPPRLKVVR